MTNKDLILEAINAKQNAACSFTNYAVGAALETVDGKIYKGANIEHSISGLGICAERAAFVSALSNGERKFKSIAVVGSKTPGTIDLTLIPCGACLQYMLEFAEDILVVCYIDGQIVEKKISDFLKSPYKYTK